MMRSIINNDGRMKARITFTRAGFCRVVMLERIGDSQVAEFPTGERGARRLDFNWRVLWTTDFDLPLHVVCDRVHDHVAASRRDVLTISL